MKFKRTFKYKLFNRILIFGFITWIQRLNGLTSKVPEREGYHYILLDIDNLDYYSVEKSLGKILIKYNINGFIIFSDKPNSYRIFSNTEVDYKTFLKIMLDTEGLDRMFFRWTVIRGYATIRVQGKKNRIKDKIIGVVGKPDYNFVRDKLKFIQYETDIEGDDEK